MAKGSFIFRAGPSFRALVGYLVKDEDFISDAFAILDIDQPGFESLAKALAESQPFLDRKALSAIVEETLGKDDRSNSISLLIWRLNEVLRDAEESLETAIDLLCNEIAENSEKGTENEREKVGERIRVLVCSPPGFTRQFKAERLVEATGTELEDVQIICDVRPIFNEERSEIEGAIPISTLVLDLVEPNGTSSRIQVCLKEADVVELSKKVEYAKGKLAAIRSTLAEKAIVLPSTSATVDERTAE